LSISIGDNEAMEEYLTYDELAAILKLELRSCYKLKEHGVLKPDIHWVHPVGLGVRFKKSAIIAWLEGGRQEGAQRPAPALSGKVVGIRMARGYHLGG
jgi:hypothetical protein